MLKKFLFTLIVFAAALSIGAFGDLDSTRAPGASATVAKRQKFNSAKPVSMQVARADTAVQTPANETNDRFSARFDGFSATKTAFRETDPPAARIETALTRKINLPPRSNIYLAPDGETVLFAAINRRAGGAIPRFKGFGLDLNARAKI